MPYDVNRKHGIYWVYICGINISSCHGARYRIYNRLSKNSPPMTVRRAPMLRNRVKNAYLHPGTRGSPNSMNLNVNVNLELRQSHAQFHMHHRLTRYIKIYYHCHNI